MKKYNLLFITAAIFLILAACGKKDLSEELIEYYNEKWIPIHLVKKEGMNKFQAELALLEFNEHDTHDVKSTTDSKQEIIEQMNENFIPVAEEVIEQFEAIELKHQKLEKLNDMQIEAERFARALIDYGIDYYNGDISQSEYEKEEIKLKRKYDNISNYIDQLMDEYNLEFDMEKDSGEGLYELKRKQD